MRQTSKRRASREGGGAKSSAPRTNLYDDVTRRIISELEAGRFPWVQPGGRPDGEGGTAAPGLPRKARTGRSYSGLTVHIFWGAVMEQESDWHGHASLRSALIAGGGGGGRSG